jgi:hypothetical protein
MTARRWIVFTVATLVGGIAFSTALGIAVDPYGLFRDPTGRKLPIYVSTSVRRAKFLMNKRYVPANFDGLLVGASQSLLWSLPNLSVARVFNDSVGGQNTVEAQYYVN